MGVITYTLLCGYSPFRSENLQDLIDECSSAQVVFHERYWKDGGYLGTCAGRARGVR